MAVNSAAALSREANSLPENGSGSFFLGPGLTFVAAGGERPLHLHGLALRAFDLCLPHVEVAGDPEIVLANQASTLMDLGRYEEAQAAATRALQCQELPGSIQSFAQHSVGRAAEAQGDTARAAGGPLATDTVAHYARAKAAYKAAVVAAGEKGDEASSTAFVRVQIKAAAEGTFTYGLQEGQMFYVRAVRPNTTIEMVGGKVVVSGGDGAFAGIAAGAA